MKKRSSVPHSQISFIFSFIFFLLLNNKLSVPRIFTMFHPTCDITGYGINTIIIVEKEPNLWALCTSHTVGNNEKAGGRFAASRLSNSFRNSLAQLNLCKVQPFWCIKTNAII